MRKLKDVFQSAKDFHDERFSKAASTAASVWWGVGAVVLLACMAWSVWVAHLNFVQTQLAMPHTSQFHTAWTSCITAGGAAMVLAYFALLCITRSCRSIGSEIRAMMNTMPTKH